MTMTMYSQTTFSSLILIFISFRFQIIFYSFCVMCICVEVRGHLWKLILTFHHVDPGDQTQVVRLSSKCLYLLSHLTGPILVSLNKVSLYSLGWPGTYYVTQIGLKSKIFLPQPLKCWVYRHLSRHPDNMRLMFKHIE